MRKIFQQQLPLLLKSAGSATVFITNVLNAPPGIVIAGFAEKLAIEQKRVNQRISEKLLRVLDAAIHPQFLLQSHLV